MKSRLLSFCHVVTLFNIKFPYVVKLFNIKFPYEKTNLRFRDVTFSRSVGVIDDSVERLVNPLPKQHSGCRPETLELLNTNLQTLLICAVDEYLIFNAIKIFDNIKIHISIRCC